MFETISIERDARGVATLWLDRAEKHNALSAQMIAELTQAAGQLAADEAVRVVVLAAKGKTFCAGGDLGWMREQFEADPQTRSSEAAKLAHMLQALNTLPKPMIGRLHGNAFGGGLGMASVCDVAIGADHILLGFTETRLGLIPATIGPYVCARMGEDKARRVFMSGRRFGADEGVTLNLLARAVPEAELDAAIEAEVVPYLECAPGAVARVSTTRLSLTRWRNWRRAGGARKHRKGSAHFSARANRPGQAERFGRPLDRACAPVLFNSPETQACLGFLRITSAYSPYWYTVEYIDCGKQFHRLEYVLRRLTLIGGGGKPCDSLYSHLNARATRMKGAIPWTRC